MKNETEDIVYRCKDCSKYNLCRYYYRRKETSQICHYFELQGKTGKWIAFKDEQPQVNVSVLICDVDGDIYISHRTMSDTYYDETGNWLKNLRAWMPLPEPYKEVDE